MSANNYQQFRALVIDPFKGFTDPGFPPSPSILPAHEDAFATRWVRACEIAGVSDPRNIFHRPICFGDVCFQTGPADSGDVRQVGMGDCWFLAAIAGLADINDGAEIKKLFKTEDNVPIGKGIGVGSTPETNIYSVELFDPRPEVMQKVVLEIDGWIPCKPESKTPRYTRAADGVFWPLLLEKALAKMLGHYAGLYGGFSALAFDILTGCKSEFIGPTTPGDKNTWVEVRTSYTTGKDNPRAAYRIHGNDILTDYSNLNELWIKLNQAQIEPRALMAAGVGHGDGTRLQKETLKKGFYDSHAYTILEVHELGASQEETRYLKLRNPWATFYKPEDSQKRIEDNATVKAGLAESRDAAERYGFSKPGDQGADEGIGWISFEDFLNHFTGIHINMNDERFEY